VKEIEPTPSSAIPKTVGPTVLVPPGSDTSTNAGKVSVSGSVHASASCVTKRQKVPAVVATAYAVLPAIVEGRRRTVLNVLELGPICI
jgi:hypothetical protein